MTKSKNIEVTVSCIDPTAPSENLKKNLRACKKTILPKMANNIVALLQKKKKNAKKEAQSTDSAKEQKAAKFINEKPKNDA